RDEKLDGTKEKDEGTRFARQRQPIDGNERSERVDEIPDGQPKPFRHEPEGRHREREGRAVLEKVARLVREMAIEPGARDEMNERMTENVEIAKAGTKQRRYRRCQGQPCVEQDKESRLAQPWLACKEAPAGDLRPHQV